MFMATAIEMNWLPHQYKIMHITLHLQLLDSFIEKSLGKEISKKF